MKKLLRFLCFCLCYQFLIGMTPVDPALGVKTLHYTDHLRGDRPVVVDVWYPTDQTAPLNEEAESIWAHPPEVKNALLQAREDLYPLIVMSHGHKGDRRERTWLVDALTRQGYVVASVDHYGDTWDFFDPAIAARFWERPLDISFALDQLEQEAWLKEHVDFNRIGFIGYSLGGMTGLALAGAECPYPKEIIMYSLKSRKKLSSDEIAKIGQTDFNLGKKNYRDERIKTELLICPAVFLYPPKTLKKIQIPIGLVAAMSDEVLSHKDHAKKLIKNVPLKNAKVMQKKESHYVFLNRFSNWGRSIFKKHVPRHEKEYQERVHHEVAEFALEYFQQTL